jgi:hypothetical protein
VLVSILIEKRAGMEDGRPTEDQGLTDTALEETRRASAKADDPARCVNAFFLSYLVPGAYFEYF